MPAQGDRNVTLKISFQRPSVLDKPRYLFSSYCLKQRSDGMVHVYLLDHLVSPVWVYDVHVRSFPFAKNECRT